MTAISPAHHVRLVGEEVLSDDWYVLRKATFDLRGRDGRWTRVSREAYDRGDGAAILLYDPRAASVVLVRQFRWPPFSKGHSDGMLIEVPAGLLDGEAPGEAIRREVEEETGIEIGAAEPLWTSFMSPGSVTERLHFFAAPYRSGSRDGSAGGVRRDGEETEILEVTLPAALEMVSDGRIVDAKTVMLLWWAEREGLCG